jgi:hypothetical protein
MHSVNGRVIGSVQHEFHCSACSRNETLAVKSRFFAQYWKQNVLRENRQGFEFALDTVGTQDNELVCFKDSYLQLKPLSKITDEDAEKLQYTLVNVVGLDGLIRQNSVDLVKEVVSNYEKVECLFMLPSLFSDLARELGYAIDWNNYKVSKQIELGWVQLL